MSTILTLCIALVTVCLCNSASGQAPASQPRNPDGKLYRNQPLVTSIFTADPSAHWFDGRIYVYCSHDISEGPSLEDVEPFTGSQGNGYKMRDYVILSMDKPGGEVTIHPNVLDIKDVPWAARQMWAPDCAYKNGTYYLYFPAKDRAGAFRIGVATAKNPIGPFIAQPEPIKGSFSIDPAVFTDDDGKSYLYFGGLSGGQLQKSINGIYNRNASEHDDTAKDQPALTPKVAMLRDDMLEFAEPLRDVTIVDKEGKPLLAGDGARRFFEASWMHKHNGKYYFSYSTGGSHLLTYGISDSPYGPFVHQGNILLPVQGWTTHHSIIQIDGRWWLFYADSQISSKNHLRNVKVTELFYNPDGTIQTIDPFVKE